MSGGSPFSRFVCAPLTAGQDVGTAGIKKSAALGVTYEDGRPNSTLAGAILCEATLHA